MPLFVVSADTQRASRRANLTNTLVETAAGRTHTVALLSSGGTEYGWTFSFRFPYPPSPVVLVCVCVWCLCVPADQPADTPVLRARENLPCNDHVGLPNG